MINDVKFDFGRIGEIETKELTLANVKRNKDPAVQPLV